MPPRIAVLLAAYNGVRWLSEQIDSILSQREVDLQLYVSVDRSSDGTEDLVAEYANKDSRVTCLPDSLHFGSAARNFFRLIRDVDPTPFDYVAFSDQDDIWCQNRLVHAVRMMSNHGAAGYSSNVVAFWENGQDTVVKKDFAMRRYDYMFEGPGPGCTFVMAREPFTKLKRLCLEREDDVASVRYHDWLTYALFRNSGWKWFIDSYIGVRYRQHSANDTGANIGASSKKKRLDQIRSGWARDQVFYLANLIGYSRLLERYLAPTLLSKLRFMRLYRQFRRRPRDAFVLLAAVLMGYFTLDSAQGRKGQVNR